MVENIDNLRNVVLHIRQQTEELNKEADRIEQTIMELTHTAVIEASDTYTCNNNNGGGIRLD